ncbi:MAG: TolC family protein [Flectobacillus sp.]|uniref:TolC family protein n=1 Tax=Flectobacillus sp. TaxID=50419 RepID=UPI003B9A9034
MYKKVLGLWGITLLICCAEGAIGQKGSSNLSIHQAIETATTNYPTIRAKLLAIEAKQKESEATNLTYTMPSVVFQAQTLFATSNQVRGTYFSNEGAAIPSSGTTNINDVASEPVFSSFATILTSYKLATFGKKEADLKVANANIQQAKMDYEKEIYLHKAKVTDAYILSLVFQEATKIQQKNIERAQAFYQTIKANALAGLRAGVDTSLAIADIAKAKILLIESQKLAEQQKVRLAELLGTPLNTYALSDAKLVTSQPFALTVTPNENLNNHPILQYFASRVNASLLRINSVQKAYLPTIMARGAVWGKGSGIEDHLGADGNYVYNQSLSGLGFRAYNYLLGLTTVWNVADIFRIKKEVSAQNSLTQAFQRDMDEASIKIQSEIAQSSIEYQKAKEVFDQIPIQLESAKAAYSQAQARYQAGLGTILEVTQTQMVLNRAEIDEAVAKNNVWRAVLHQYASNGDLSSFLSQFN